MRHLLLPLACLLLAACTSSPIEQHFPNRAAQALPEQQQALLAAVSEVDITPPPGLPKAGFSSWAAYGDGFRTRLKARIYYLRGKDSQPLVLIQTDLLAGSEILHAALSSRLAAITEIAPQNLVITANHTHAAPGQYFGSDFYNKHASNAPGFDQRWFDFLAEQIEQGILKSRDELRPAKLAVGQREVWGLTRNRSLQPYLQNPEITDKRDTPERVFKAINPLLTLVRVDLQDSDGEYRPAGAFSSFSIHGTGIGSNTGYYHADVWAYIANSMAWKVQQSYGLKDKLVHGAFEATHGDVAPNEKAGQIGFAEARRVGNGISEQAYALFRELDGKLHDQVQLRSALREVDVLQQPAIGDIRLCQPAAGAALAAGAYEHRSPVIWQLPIIRPGQPRLFFKDTCQGGKHWLATAWLQPLILPPAEFPHKLLLQTLQIDNSFWAMLPFEVTTMSGKLVEKQLEGSLRQANIKPDALVVSSVANGYTGYVTTPAEYALQYYEGGHTLYGPQTAPFLASHSGQLLKQMLQQGSFADLPESRSFQLSHNRFWPQPESASQRRLLEQPQWTPAQGNEEGYWSVEWEDQAPADMAFHQPLLRIEQQQDGEWTVLRRDGRAEDDQGFDLGVRWLGGRRYEARWYNPPSDSQQPLRLSIAPRAEQAELHIPLTE